MSAKYTESGQRRSCHRARETAKAADRMRTRTPVAYAPLCASTLARKMRVTMTLTTSRTSTSVEAQSGAYATGVRGPGGRHAEAREVARQEVEEARHGRGTR